MPNRSFLNVIFAASVTASAGVAAAAALADAPRASAFGTDEARGEARTPVLFPGQAERAQLLEQIASDAAVSASWKRLTAVADAALEAEPKPIRVIEYEGILATDARRIRSTERLLDMARLHVLVEAYLVTGEDRHADKARAFIRAWTARYEPNGNPINENKLEPILHGYHLLRDTFDAAERQAIDAWVLSLAQAIRANDLHAREHRPTTIVNNWHPKRLKVYGWAGLILQDPQWSQLADDGTKEFIEVSLRGDGTSRDLEERDALSYHVNALKPVMAVAPLLGEAGGSIFTYENSDGGSLRRSVDFVNPFATGEATRVEFQNSRVEFDRRRAEAGLAMFQPGREFDPQQARELFVMAAAFDPHYLPLAKELSAASDDPVAAWDVALAGVGYVRETPEGRRTLLAQLAGEAAAEE